MNDYDFGIVALGFTIITLAFCGGYLLAEKFKWGSSPKL